MWHWCGWSSAPWLIPPSSVPQISVLSFES
jgi:hypothetical protein